MRIASSNHNITWTEEQGPEIFGSADPKLIAKFKRFHEENPVVYAMFFNKALEIWGTGRRRYSQWRIAHVITWDMDIKTSGSVFVINNDFIACYARLLIFHHPMFKGFFELRTMKNKRVELSTEESRRILEKTNPGVPSAAAS